MKTYSNNTDFKLSDIYKSYKDSVKNPVTKEQFRKILNKFNDETTNLIINESFEFRLPYRLGYLRIKKFKLKLKLDADGKLKKSALKIDWKATNTLWKENEVAKEEKKLVYHTNQHTNGNYFKWFWDKGPSNVSNLSVYQIKMSRANLRSLAKAVKTNEELDYYE